MAHLADMEELVSSVMDNRVRDYMEEALACYMAGAYRASVVLTFIALFDDVLNKLGELGKVNKKARLIHAEATKRRGDQEVYETYLVDQLKSNNLLTSLDAGFLDTLRTLRNKAAHPSGHQASAEEARFVFFEATSRFLSKPILSTTQMADQILASLGGENVFPSAKLSDVVAVVRKDLQGAHHEVFPYLVTKLLDKARDAHKETSRNAKYFLCGMAKMGNDSADSVLRKYAVEQLASSTRDAAVVMALLGTNGKLFSGLDSVTYKRISALFGGLVESTSLAQSDSEFSHPVMVAIGILSENSFSLVSEELGDSLSKFLSKYCYSARFTKFALSAAAVRELLFDRLYDRAGSSDFYVANSFVKHANDLEVIAGDEIEGREAYRLLIGVVRAAEIGAFAAIDMRNGRFGALPKLRAKARNYYCDNPDDASSIAQRIYGEEEIGEPWDWLNSPGGSD